MLPRRQGHTTLGIAVLLKRFPDTAAEVPVELVEALAAQLGVSSDEWIRYEWGSRAWKRHRRQIRDALGYRPCTVADA